MRIGIDARTLSGRCTGDRTYWRGLLEGLAQIDGENEYVLYIKRPIEGEPLRVGLNFSWRTIPKPEPDAVWIQTAFLAALRQDRIDIAHTQYNIPLLGLPCPTITTIHDVSWMAHPEFFPAKDLAVLRRFIPGSMRRACAVIAVSESTRRDILRYYKDHIEPDKIHVTLLAVDERFQPPADVDAAQAAANARLGLSDLPYILSVGVLQPRKNLPLLLDAFALAVLGPVDFPHRLLVVGKRGWENDALDAKLKTLPPEVVERIVFTGYVDDAHLPELFGGATVFCYPSVYEGFGLPPLEAMSCGCPAVVAQTSSLPEVVGDAGILLPAKDSEPWARAIEKIVADPAARSRWSDRARERAAAFDWRETARRTLAVYESCLKENVRASRS